jgi:hypothetical protein
MATVVTSTGIRKYADLGVVAYKAGDRVMTSMGAGTVSVDDRPLCKVSQRGPVVVARDIRISGQWGVCVKLDQRRRCTWGCGGGCDCTKYECVDGWLVSRI